VGGLQHLTASASFESQASEDVRHCRNECVAPILTFGLYGILACLILTSSITARTRHALVIRSLRDVTVTAVIRRFYWNMALAQRNLSRQMSPVQAPRDWVALTAASMPGLAVVIALIFTGLHVHVTDSQLQAAQNQLQVTEQGQITDRYNATITNLGSGFIDIRLGGIYALQSLMQDSPRDQPTIIAVLCAFARDRSASNPDEGNTSALSPPADVQAALTVVGSRCGGGPRNPH